VDRFRERLTYANVMSSLAIFLVLGGATAFAASQLGRNSVGSKQLKKNAVTAAKIKVNAVTEAKIQEDAVTGAKVRDGSLAGKDIDLGSLGTVPSAARAATAENAARAATADSAAKAATAENAAKANGQTPVKVFQTLLPGQQNVQLASIAGFSIRASCDAGDVDATLTTSGDQGSTLIAQGNGSEGPYFLEESHEAGTPSRIELDGGKENTGEVSFSAVLSDGTVLSGNLAYDIQAFGGEGADRCIVFGEVTTG